MDFFDILFDMKNGSKMPYSKNYFDTLFAAKLNDLGVKTLTGTLPLAFRTSETALRSWTIYGNNYEHKYSTSGTLPLTFSTHTAGAADTWTIYGNEEGVGEQRQDGYYVPITVSQQGQTDKTVDIYIGDSPLLSGDYADYERGKIYKAKRIHEDTVTIDGIVWDILDYDHDEVYKADGTRAKRTVTIQTHDCINELQYSARQAAFAFPEGLAAGTYKFTVGAHPWVAGDVGKVLTFTLANAITAGGQLVFNGTYDQTLVGTTISVFASPTDTTATETVTMTEGSTGTDLGTILRSKTDTINSIDRALFGSNNWLESAMRQYLNSDKAAGSVWTPQSVFDRPPAWATTTAGFLNGKSADFLSHIGTAKKITGLNMRTDGGRTAVHDEKLFLLSRSEAYMGDDYAGGEGTPYTYYKDYSDNPSASTAADSNRIKYRAGVAKNWWLRSPIASYANYVRVVYASGAWSNFGAANTNGVAPACCIVLDDMDDWVKQTFYTEIADLPTIELFSGDNIIDTSLYNKPSMSIEGVDYVGVGEPTNDGWQIPLTVTHYTDNIFDKDAKNTNKGYEDGICIMWVGSIPYPYMAGNEDNNYFVSEKIPCSPNTTYYLSDGIFKNTDNGIYSVFLWNRYRMSDYQAFPTEKTFITGDDTKFIQVCVLKAYADTVMITTKPTETYIPHVEVNNVNVPIDAPLTEGQSVTDTLTINTFEGENVLDTTLDNKPQMSITYKGG